MKSSRHSFLCNDECDVLLMCRKGMHRYNNKDHSMLTAKIAVDNIVADVADKSNIWASSINDEYQEQKQSGEQ